MPRIRVLVVDDAVVVRRLVSEALASDPDIEVVGTASNGRLALARIPQVNPDLITMDIEMPEMDGLQTLRELRKQWPRLPVIMVSTLTVRGGAATLDALALGASDYVTKPTGADGMSAALERLRNELVPRVKSLCGMRGAPKLTAPVAQRPAPPRSAVARLRAGAAPQIVVIGVSTGGPNALAAVVPQIPESFPVPIVIVQHMPPLFTRLLADRLDGVAQIAVREAVDGDVLKAGTAYVAPGDFHVEVMRDAKGDLRLRTQQEPPENSCRPAADVLFRTAAHACGAATLAVVLTGMGQDGLRGSQAVHEAGGQVLVQDEATSVVWGMPGFVAGAGLAERVLPLERVAAELVQRTQGVVGHIAPAVGARS